MLRTLFSSCKSVFVFIIKVDLSLTVVPLFLFGVQTKEIFQICSTGRFMSSEFIIIKQINSF